MKRRRSFLLSAVTAFVFAVALMLTGNLNFGRNTIPESKALAQQEALIQQTVTEKRQQLEDYEGLYNNTLYCSSKYLQRGGGSYR